MIDSDQISRLKGATVLDAEGHKVGTVGQAFLDATDGNPRWVTVRTGLLGRRESFVPLEGADLDGDVLRIRYGKATVKDAPHMDPDSALSSEEESALYRYYDVGSAGGQGLRKHDDRQQELDDDEELPEERPRVATAPVPPGRRHLLAETVLEFPEDDDQIRRSQIDFDGEVGRDRV
ncbi:PRC-barrel domain-containing protein [Naasia sp. SYSU D00948]|uniref:PRC-barrel domain-containing protein n=1 Tax=Naasia sp. SYSU D00948 TaxID=2817379 RepID=UPI001B3037AE|nr:PRC-barrel domain-containing protein [Naasia sp. SYSU D00948]